STSGGGERLGAPRRGGQPIPSLAETDGLARAGQQLFLGIVMLPTTALVEIKEMRATPFGERTPFLRDLHGHTARDLRGHSLAPWWQVVWIVARVLDASNTRKYGRVPAGSEYRG